MDDLSSSNIHEDVIIFSSRKVNAWKATIKSGSTIVLGGTRETLRDILKHRMELSSNFKREAVSHRKAQEIPANAEIDCGSFALSELTCSTPQTPSIDDDYETIVGDEAREAAKGFASVSMANGTYDISDIVVPGDVHVHYGDDGKINDLVFRKR